ncbi:hypothetical protein PROVALCAL_01418 [Providencia alcalifaciens DSM 30120]|uniref:Uncharacterized protein n=1 Tax=Providencia alcalifaciens DSM 30120 TaxID=520999 RepID=B6XDJ6_9GAMM|nr:hypothetical protein PROVALCAL_01418 [Providencia alcalifaciens DSM 30120]
METNTEKDGGVLKFKISETGLFWVFFRFGSGQLMFKYFVYFYVMN